jgi:hypothetical protein
MKSGFWTGVIVGVAGTWAFHRFVRPIKTSA